MKPQEDKLSEDYSVEEKEEIDEYEGNELTESDLFGTDSEETYVVDTDDVSMSSEAKEEASEMTIIKTTTEDEFGDVESTDDSVDDSDEGKNEKNEEEDEDGGEDEEDEKIYIKEKKKEGHGEMPPILAEGELMRKIDFSNGSKYNYCFKSGNKKDCDADFAKARCGAVRNYHGCLTRERGCQFRFKPQNKKCCLMYSCVSRQQSTATTTGSAEEESSGSTTVMAEEEEDKEIVVDSEVNGEEESSGSSTIIAEESDKEEEDTSETIISIEKTEIEDVTEVNSETEEGEEKDKSSTTIVTGEEEKESTMDNIEAEGTTHPDMGELNERYGTTEVEKDEEIVKESSVKEKTGKVDVTDSGDVNDDKEVSLEESSADYPSYEEDGKKEFDQSEAEVTQCVDASPDECEEKASKWCENQQCFGTVLGQCQWDMAENGTCCMRYICTEDKMMEVEYDSEETTESVTETTSSYELEIEESEDDEMLNRLLGDNDEEQSTEKTNTTLEKDETGSGDVVKDILGEDLDKDRYNFERSSRKIEEGEISEVHKKIVTDIKEGETIVHYFYRGVSDLTDALRPHHCAPSPLCMVSETVTSPQEVIILIVFRFWKTRTFAMALSFSAQLTTPATVCSATVWWTLPVDHLQRKVDPNPKL